MEKISQEILKVDVNWAKKNNTLVSGNAGD